MSRFPEADRDSADHLGRHHLPECGRREHDADFGETIDGNPTLITQQATTQVLVTDGGTVVIGGVIQTNNSINVQQVPLLGSIPWLGELFKHTTVSTSNQELIFFITPRIIQT